MINFDFPNNTEDYVHRIGRTARADQHGTAYSFFTSSNAKQARELIDILKEAKQQIPPRLYQMLEISKQMHMAKCELISSSLPHYLIAVVCAVFTAARQRYRVRDDKRRNEDRAGMNGRGGGGGGGGGGSSYSSRNSGGVGGTTSWSEGGEKGYLGGLGKYNQKKDSSAGVDSGTSAYTNTAAFSYNPQTNSITPNYGVPTSASYSQYTPYQNGAGATGYPSYQQPAFPPAPGGVPPPPQPQQVYYAPPPPPPPPGQ